MYAHTRPIITHCNYRQLSLVLTLCLLVLPAHADTLKSSTIESFLASLQDMESIFYELEENEPKAELADDAESDDEVWSMDFTRMYSRLAEEMSKNPPVQRKLNAVAERHGFENLEQWGQTGDRIYTAYMAINMEGQPAMDMEAMENYMGSMEALPDADRQEIRTRMEAIVKSNEVIRNVPTRDIEAVRPYVTEIMALYRMEEDGSQIKGGTEQK
ncbi:MAG: hypothetical protein SV429_07220 [Pseudomonadota bacterium]|nr:hypothetical protein [Pseudomonadota bacterium]